MPTRDLYDLIAEDLAYWLEYTSDALAIAMAPQGVAPFGAVLSTQQKLEYYRAQLFNQDGSPNVQGRTNLVNLLGPKGFADVYHAVTSAYPDLKIPTPPGEGGQMEPYAPQPAAAPPPAWIAGGVP
jgi:hypothetical protein